MRVEWLSHSNLHHAVWVSRGEDCASLTFPADTTSFVEQSPISLEPPLCGLGDPRRPKPLELSTSALEELQREALRADIECAKMRLEAANEERRYWEEKRSLLALEKQLLLERHQLKPNNDQSNDRMSNAVEDRMYWEERRRMLALKKQCMLDQMG
ncbi:hypothetical protein RB195_008824 [Necator americanus]|uniref:Uncharacterized protein n=1 Tax=Necator americanus TaxID=51031 RepID=A0ABR1CQJ0_NECAM